MLLVPLAVTALVYGAIVLIGEALGPLDIPPKHRPSPPSKGGEHPPKPSA